MMELRGHNVIIISLFTSSHFYINISICIAPDVINKSAINKSARLVYL